MARYFQFVLYQKIKTMHYKKLAISSAISFVIMYAVMFLNVDSGEHIYLSATRLYMTILMVAPMQITMILLMRKMYSNEKLNAIIILSSIVIFSAALLFLRRQTLISDQQYMKAMIPHHSSAIMTSKNASIKDPEVKQLSIQIIESQEREIKQMKEILKRMESSK